MIVLSCDPGLMSGVAIIDFDTTKILVSDELNPDDTWRFFELAFEQKWGKITDIVAERFTITAETGKKSQAPWSLKLLGVLEYLADRNGFGEVPLQTPAEAKGFVPNQRLKNLRLWHKGGEGHALDALRHAVLYAVKNGYRDPRLLVE